MRRLLTAAVLSASIPAWAGQIVTLAAQDDGFAVSSTATGTIRKDGLFLAGVLTRHTVRASKGFKAPTKVFEYRVGLARNNEDGRWDVECWLDFVPAGFTLQPGDTKQLPSTTALIPVDNLHFVQGAWLVIQVKVQRGGTTGTTYSHSGLLSLN